MLGPWRLRSPSVALIVRLWRLPLETQGQLYSLELPSPMDLSRALHQKNRVRKAQYSMTPTPELGRWRR